MKINSKFINDIFDLKIKLKNKKDKIKLSKYEELIPMYDIYSNRIFKITKYNLYDRLISSNYRFINKEICDWITILYNKTKLDLFKNNLDIIDNYDIPTLINTSYATLYKYSKNLGLQISICKKNSFNQYIYHQPPYYTKDEIVKLGQNMDLLKSDFDTLNLIDNDMHYKICKQISNNDVSFEEIKNHHLHIIKNNCISWVCFYSFYGSFIYNSYLRNPCNKNKLTDTFKTGLNKIVKCIQSAPPLNNNYDLYRFIHDDSYLSNLNVGDIFIDNGFISSTRDPFYTPVLNGQFGLILIKIKIPKDIEGVGLFLENFSLFPGEEEFILPPNSHLKLLNKNDNFTYYHTNEQFQKLITKKYEFQLIIKRNNFKLLSLTNKQYEFYDIENIEIDGYDRYDLLVQFIKLYAHNNTIYLSIKSTQYTFNYNWFDSTPESSYAKLYHNKMIDGLCLTIYSDGYPSLNIELGKEMVINYINKYYYSNTNYELTGSILELITELGRIFHYESIIIYHAFNNYNEFSNNRPESDLLFLNINLYNKTLYSYLKNGTKYLDYSFTTYDTGYWYLDNYFDKEIPQNIRDAYNNFNYFSDLKTIRELFITTVEKYFYVYKKIINKLVIADKNIENIFFNKTYITLNVLEALETKGKKYNIKPNFHFKNDNQELDMINFNLIFKQPIRRI